MRVSPSLFVFRAHFRATEDQKLHRRPAGGRIYWATMDHKPVVRFVDLRAVFYSQFSDKFLTSCQNQ